MNSEISQKAELTTEDEAGERFLPFDLKGVLPDLLIQRAEEELGETPEIRRQALQELKDLILAEKKPFTIDDDVLIMFLRAKKFDVKKAFQMMGNLWNFKVFHYDIQAGFEHLKREMDIGYCYFLPKRDALGRAILICKLGLFDPDRMSFKTSLSARLTYLAKVLEDPANQVAGVISIMDCADISTKHLKYYNFSNMKFLYSMYEDAFPCRYQGVHILNINPLMKFFLQIVQMLASKKLKERIHIHGKDLKSLHKHIPPAILPPEYGGTHKTERELVIFEDFLNTKLLS